MFRVPEMSGGREGMMVMSLFRYMWTDRELKMAVHASSQICPTDSSDPEASLGKACDLVVERLRHGSGSCAVAVDVMICPLGTMTCAAGFVTDMFWWGRAGVI
jgi:hypothetical protein